MTLQQTIALLVQMGKNKDTLCFLLVILTVQHGLNHINTIMMIVHQYVKKKVLAGINHNSMLLFFYACACFSVFVSYKDSGDEMSSDSLSLALFEEDSSGEETQIQGHLTTKKLKGKQSSASCFQEDSFIPAEPEKEKYLLSDKPERQPELLMVTYCYIFNFWNIRPFDGLHLLLLEEQPSRFHWTSWIQSAIALPPVGLK